MGSQSNKSMWIFVVVLAVCLQVVFVFADCKQTATGTAIDFSKAYFMLNADMEKYVCSDLVGEDNDSAVTAFLEAVDSEAREMGFGKGMFRKMIYHVKTDTLTQDTESATIHIHGVNRTCIHPVFTFVAKLFQLGQISEFEETLDIVKEDGQWKVCGTPFGMSLDS